MYRGLWPLGSKLLVVGPGPQVYRGLWPLGSKQWGVVQVVQGVAPPGVTIGGYILDISCTSHPLIFAPGGGNISAGSY